MNCTQFHKQVTTYLSRYNKGEQGKDEDNGGTKPYILKVSKENKKEMIRKYSLLSLANKEPFLFDGKPHGFGTYSGLHAMAHHLNSSQITCYNFFRPLILEDRYPSITLIKLLKRYCPKLDFEINAECAFEYKDASAENTSFDFFLKSGETEIFVEAKYTENNFGKESKSIIETKFEDVYRQMIADNSVIWKSKPSKEEFMDKYYQLGRNCCRAIADNKYVLFICPEDATYLKDAYNEFRLKFIKDDCSNIVYLTWEELTSYLKGIGYNGCDEFETRYFGYKKAGSYEKQGLTEVFKVDIKSSLTEYLILHKDKKGRPFCELPLDRYCTQKSGRYTFANITQISDIVSYISTKDRTQPDKIAKEDKISNERSLCRQIVNTFVKHPSERIYEVCYNQFEIIKWIGGALYVSQEIGSQVIKLEVEGMQVIDERRKLAIDSILREFGIKQGDGTYQVGVYKILY